MKILVFIIKAKIKVKLISIKKNLKGLFIYLSNIKKTNPGIIV